MSDIVHALLIEDHPEESRLFHEHLRAAAGGDRFDVSLAPTLAKGLLHLAEHATGLVFLDLGLPDSQGLETYEAVRRAQPRLPVIILSGTRDEELAVRAVKAGAQNYLFKDEVTGDLIVRAAHYAVARANIENALLDSKAALSVSELRYRRLFETAQDGILILDAQNGMIVDVNPYLIEMLGFSHEQFTGKKIWELGAFKDVVANRDNLLELQREKYIRYEDLPLVTADGKKIEVEFVSNVYAVNGGKVIQCNIRDITKRKKAEAAFRESESRYRRLFESAKDGILILDAKTGLIVDVNPYLTELLGFSHEQATGKSIWELGVFKDVISNQNKFLELQRNRYVRYEDLPLETAGGRKIEVEFVSNAYDENQRKVIQCNIRDITERIKAEAAFRESELRYRRLFESAQDGILILDAETGLIIDVNPYLIEMLGFSHEQFTGKSIWELGAFKDIVANRDNFLELQRNEYIRYEDLPLETAAGRKIEVEFVSNVYAVNGGKVIQCNIRDITSRKQAENEIQELNAGLERRVAERTAELETFAYSVSHDLRAPLRAIDGFTGILIEDNAAALNEEGKRVCAVIRDNAQRMGRLIDNLLSFSRLGTAPLDPVRIDMKKAAESVLTEAFETASPSARERVDFKIGALRPARGDPSLIRQVWTNLISNALKFSSRRERAVISVTGEEKEGESVYCVRDNGAGYDMRYENKLFGVFQRLHDRKEFEGTGVGLAIVKRIVARHGGRVWASGAPDKGAAFYFSLPLNVASGAGGEHD